MEMATRHSRKERERMDKIRALERMGFVINSKTNAARVDAKLDEVFGMILEVVSQDAERKRARNRRKRARRK